MRYCILCIALILCTTQVYAQGPTGVKAMDTPNDSGGSITVTWDRADLPAGAKYKLAVSESKSGPFHPVADIDPSDNLQSSDPGTFGHGEETSQIHFAKISEYTDPSDASKSLKITSEKTYYVQVTTQLPSGDTLSSPAAAAEALQNLFNRTKTNNFIVGTLFSLIILVGIVMAQRRELFIRRIAGLEALDEALGRATEMGKPVLFIHGLHPMGSVSTIAAINVLSRVANRTAEFNTELRVANQDPIVMAVSQEVVKESYLNAGRPDAYNEGMVFMVATEQFSYAAALDGMMVRDRPATNILMGYFYAESLLLAETGASTGAIQIAGTDSYTQLPFFITTCDYTLMGEELYAASAYLSREPKLLGSLKGQDIGKAILLAVIVGGTLLATLGNQTLTYIFTAY